MHDFSYIGYMTKEQLISRIRRVKGLTVKDPWGTDARVFRLDGDFAWLEYAGLHVPFRRSLDSLVWAANGGCLADRSNQFAKRLVGPSGVPVTLFFEPYYVTPARPSLATARPTLESLRRTRPKPSKRR